MNYADLKWSIIQEWNSNGKYTNEYLIEIGAEAGVEIKNTHADRKSIVAKISDEMITAGVESGEYVVDGMGEDCDNDINFKRYMGDLTIPAPTLKLEDSPMLTFEEMGMSVDEHEHEHEDGTVHSHPHEGEHSHDEEKYSYEDEEEEELPDFKKMSKKKLDDWALDRGIELDRRQTKAHMITDLEEHLEV